VLQK
jgi:hypothetical protein